MYERSCTCPHRDSSLDADIYTEDVQLKDEKAPGEDRITYEIG